MELNIKACSPPLPSFAKSEVSKLEASNGVDDDGIHLCVLFRGMFWISIELCKAAIAVTVASNIKIGKIRVDLVESAMT